MRMDGAWRLVLAAVVAIEVVSVCLGCLERYGISGGAVTLEAKVNAGPSLTEISWKKGKDLVAEWPLGWFAPRFSGKVVLDSANGSLTLRKLQQNDSGEYTAEVLLGSTYQKIVFCLQILEHPKPPQLNCTAIGDGIQVSCELDSLYAAANLSLTYNWKYQKSNKQILGSSSEIWLEKDVDLSENITCEIHVLDANAGSSISLRNCIPTGAALQLRNRALLLVPFAVFLGVGTVLYLYLWEKGYFNLRSKGTFNFKRKGKSQECKDGNDHAEASQEEPCLREEPSGYLEENCSKDGNDPAEASQEEPCLREEPSGYLEENCSKDPSDPGT